MMEASETIAVDTDFKILEFFDFADSGNPFPDGGCWCRVTLNRLLIGFLSEERSSNGSVPRHCWNFHPCGPGIASAKGLLVTAVDPAFPDPESLVVYNARRKRPEIVACWKAFQSRT